MKIRTLALLLSVCFLLQGCFQKLQRMQTAKKTSPFPQLDFEGLVKRYMNKEKFNSIEGIYSVSGSVTKKGKGFMGSTEKEKTTDRQDNYARVAILRDSDDAGAEFIELALGDEKLTSYPIVGEFTTAKSGNILVYKHMDAKGKNTEF